MIPLKHTFLGWFNPNGMFENLYGFVRKLYLFKTKGKEMVNMKYKKPLWKNAQLLSHHYYSQEYIRRFKIWSSIDNGILHLLVWTIQQWIFTIVEEFVLSINADTSTMSCHFLIYKNATKTNAPFVEFGLYLFLCRRVTRHADMTLLISWAKYRKAKKTLWYTFTRLWQLPY